MRASARGGRGSKAWHLSLPQRRLVVHIAGYMAPSDERAGAYSLSVDTNLLAGPSAVVRVPQKSARQGTRAKSLFCHTTFQATGKRPVACPSSIAYLFKSFNDRIYASIS